MYNLKTTIGIIGDSWADWKKLDNSIIETFKSRSVNINVSSYGLTGATSQMIYEALISDGSISNKMLHNPDIYNIVVVAGVNDSYGHRGKAFYAKNMLSIVRTINDYSKHPIIIELPEYNIEQKPKKLKSVFKQAVFRILLDGCKTDVIADYRNALKLSLETSKMLYTLLPFDPIATEYQTSKNLYNDPWHLNTEGNTLLGSYIAESIIKHLLIFK